jgi:hypothetical protein
MKTLIYSFILFLLCFEILYGLPTNTKNPHISTHLVEYQIQNFSNKSTDLGNVQINCDAVPIIISAPLAVCIYSTIYITIENSQLYNSFLWNTGETSPAITAVNISENNSLYSVTATDSNGCTAVAEWEFQIEEIFISAIGEHQFCQGGSTLIIADDNNSSFNFIYTWFQYLNGSFVEIASGPELIIYNEGIYFIVGSNSEDCPGVDYGASFTIYEVDSLMPIFSNVSLCDNAPDTLNVYGVTPNSNYSWSFNGSEISDQSENKLLISLPGVYCVTVTDPSGCTGSTCITIINYTSPSISVTDSINVCNNTDTETNTINFNQQVEGNSGVWIDIDNSGVNLSNLDQVMFNNITSGQYRFTYKTITAIEPCEDTEETMVVNVLNCPCYFTIYDTITVYDTIYTTITDTTFVTETVLVSVTDTLIININISNTSDPSITNLIKVFPNPASSHITIDNGDYLLMPNYQIRILNSVGQGVFYTPIEQKEYFLDLQSWTGKGTYFMQIIDNTGVIREIKKIILQ